MNQSVITEYLGGLQAMAAPVMSKYGFNKPVYLLAGIPVLLLYIYYLRRGGMDRRKSAFLLVRLAILVLTVVAIADPIQYSSSIEVKEFPRITVLSDSSSSMGLFNGSRPLSLRLEANIKSLAGNLTGRTDNIEMDFFSAGNSTALGDAIYRNIVKTEGDTSIMVVVSDGNGNDGRDPVDVAKAAAQANTTIYTVKPVQTGDDVYIKYVLGDRKIPSKTDYDMLIGVGNTGFATVSYDLEVLVDGRRKFNKRLTQTEFEKQTQLQLSFDNPGVYKILVKLTPDKDSVAANNYYHTTCEVVEKPRILVVSGNQSSPLVKILSSLYKVDVRSGVDQKYSDYTAVFLDDIHAKHLGRQTVNKLREYVLKGNGLVVVGGKSSYEYGAYNNSFIENILPVKATEKPEDRRKKIAVLFLIDISKSTEYGVGGDSKIDVEKALAMNMLRTLDYNDTVGVIAFNTLPYVVSGLSPLGPKRAELEDRILRLQFVGGTDMVPTMEAAIRMLTPITMPKYVILLSDGVIQRSKASLVFNKAERLKDMDVTLYSVGVGFDTDIQLMTEIARVGDGLFFHPEEYQRLKIEFGDKLEEENPERIPIVVRDKDHFITRSLAGWNNERPPAGGYNKVYEKSVAQVPFTTKGGHPILAVWRFGLGRVASLMLDNGVLWAKPVYSARGGKIVSAMTNWVIGDLEKNKKVRMSSNEVRLGEMAAVDVKSQGKPEIDLQAAGTGTPPKTTLTRTGVDRYQITFLPDTTGHYPIKATDGQESDLHAVAVNYPTEYSTLGLNEDVLSRIAYVTGGRLYEADEISQLQDELIRKAEKQATSTIIKEKELWQYLAGLALLIYFLDVVARRIIEILHLRKYNKS
ncbi:VWA domain-containing protein [Candidatus Altiarchaeota archaeon]